MSLELEHYDLSNLAYKRIKAMILDNRLVPGQKIVQEKLAQELGVSRMPLHKAFQKLENELLVEHIPRKGIFVKKVDLNMIADALECREIIEGLAVRKAAKEISQDDIRHLYTLFAPFQNKQTEINQEIYEEADMKFHNTIKKFIKNSILLKMEILDIVFQRSYQKGLIRDPKITYGEHIAIIDAIAKRDEDKAESLIRLHLRKSRQRVIEIIEKNII